ncbi:unnamed protein product [Rotaria sordida]|uniref:Uncharacterized protein n=1 Tax=Rotaria sordida TaxID=392033 RepID=A0A813WNR7_9BILA|nr:unnamed protein product [Rotaria sordida]
MINCQLILHDTNEMIDDNILQFDCLYYRVSKEKLAYQELSNVINEMIPYCFRPININKSLFRNLVNIRDQNVTFEELRISNISTQELLLWSTPIDLVEKYQLYLDEIDLSLSNELFYNCTKPWFGLQCQYSFEFSEDMSIIDIVENEFNIKTSYFESSNMLIELPCYIHIKCDRGGTYLCLDWREICNGRIDCMDEGLDEAFCFDMELNECKENEYRCQNGLCIPEEFWENGFGDADCLDRSDEFADVSYPYNCFRDPTFRCEEHTCRTNWHHFPCGDGQCVQTFNKCHSGRHLLLIQSILIQGNLSDNCSIAMMCLTKLIKETHGILCETLFVNNIIYEFIKNCDSVFQFPIIPVHLNHIRFLYENLSLKLNSDLLIIPDYVCYDEQFCDCINPTFIYENLTCLNSSILDLTLSFSEHIWIDIILSIESYFRSCLNSQVFLNDINKYENLTLLYKCNNSSKLISKHRIFDENIDCCMKDDEDYKLSCLNNDKHRIKCIDKNECLSSLHTIDDCPFNENQFEKKISFRMICDGVKQVLYEDSNGENHTDESECDYWPCNNIYTRCDGFWTCPNGQDEENCYETMCQSETYPCISPYNYSLICLSSKKVNDEINDCLGAMDELRFCRHGYPLDGNPKRFRCENNDLCLSSFQLCDNIRSCPLGDDENFCNNNRFICEQISNLNRTIIEDILCHSIDNEKNRIIYFSIHTSPNYPSLETTINNEIIQWKPKQDHIQKQIHLKNKSYSWPWYCNRGLILRIRFGYEQNQYVCMCPPSYYGHLCQYQNERVSLTLGLIRADRRDVYVIIIMLIDENQKIDSYDQFEYVASQTCGIKLNRYLLYSTRPKNISKNYSIHIDAFEKYSLIYRGSWHLSIPFLFLPVNRISALLYMPYEQTSIVLNCLIKCKNGECIKYLNKEYFFCRCFSGWSGIQCDMKLNCQSCSSDSICIGSINNRSICICPLMKFGPRCLLTSVCPKNACLNNGQCIPTDISISNNYYSCICSDHYYGLKCEYRKDKLDIYLENLNIPSFLLAFFLTISNESEPRLTIMLQKLTLFQRMVTFRISIPYNIVVVKSNRKYYLAVIQSNPNIDISTSINPSRECISIEILFNSTFMKMSRFQRMKYYHIPCQIYHKLNCFIDESHFCLCTKDHHANCLEFNYNKNLQCSSTHYCANGAQCLQDHPTCPSTIICVCTDCFFGNQCQFYAKGLGLTLDEILGYEIKHNINLSKQPFSVKLSSIITMIMLLIGIINGILSILTFTRKTSQEVGCGIYLLASSITSISIVILFSLKFWFLIYSYRDFIGKRTILFSNCMIIEPLLKLLLYIDNWLNGCVAGERAFSLFKGIYFDKKKSRKMAKWVIICVIIINIILIIPQILYLHLYDDIKEERTWCVVLYSSSLNTYSSFIIFFHFVVPFLINLFSAIFIIIGTARQRYLMKSDYRFTNHFKSKLKQHKHLLISPIIIVILSLPRLIISFTLNCKKSSEHFWLYLFGYFISFMPSVLICFVFVLPSATYKREFQQVLSRIQRRFSLIGINSFLNRHS